MKHNLVICLENVLFSVNKDVKEKSKVNSDHYSLADRRCFSFKQFIFRLGQAFEHL